MSATRGRLEGRITLTTAWTATVGGGTATIAAGTYYPSTLLTAVGTAFATASGTTCAATASLGESGTGIVTITFGSAKAIAWVSTDLRDILGFTADSASATTHTSTKQLRGVWLPGSNYHALNPVSESWVGWYESDARSAVNGAGYSWTVMGQTRRIVSLTWPFVPRSRAHIGNEVTANQSFERFARDCIWGEPSWGTAGGPIRFYPDAAATFYAAYAVPDASRIAPELAHDGWGGGPRRVELPRLVYLSSAPEPSDPPAFKLAGATATGGHFIPATVPWPTHAVDDVALLLVEGDNNSLSLDTAAGFAQVGSTLFSNSGTPISSTALAVYWCRATSTSMTNPVVAGNSGHVTAQILTFSGVKATGNPWNTYATSTSATTTDPKIVPGLTTTVDNCLFVVIVGLGRDGETTASFSAWSNASISLTEIADYTTSVGTGGGFGAAAGTAGAAGVIGDTTFTVIQDTRRCTMAIALEPL